MVHHRVRRPPLYPEISKAALKGESRPRSVDRFDFHYGVNLPCPLTVAISHPHPPFRSARINEAIAAIKAVMAVIQPKLNQTECSFGFIGNDL
jgi:hypothetical protein